MDNYDLTSYLVGIVVKEVGKPFHYDSEFDLYWDALRNPFLNLLEKERPEYNQMDDIKPTTPWIPGTGETPYRTRSGIRVLYCWNRRTGEKAWLNCDTDMFMSDEDAIRAHNNSTPFKQGDIA